MKHSDDYHDYVFKDGKLVGKFDEMYKYSKEVPWHQDKTAYSVFSDIDIAVLKQFRYDSICEIGSGLGYFSNRLHNELGSNSGERPQVTGIDISQTAIKKASKQFQEIRFVVGDILKENPLQDEYFELIVVKETLWYICHDLKKFMQNVLTMLKKDGFFYISQSFPESDKWVGKEVIDGPEELKSILIKYIKPVYINIEYDWNYNGRPLVRFLGRANYER